MRILLSRCMTDFWVVFLLHDVFNPLDGKLLVSAGQDIDEDIAKAKRKSPLEGVEIRSVLTCENQRGVCTLCYGRNLGNW